MGGPAGAMDMGPPPPPRFEPQYDPALYQHQYPPSMIRQPSGLALGNRDGDYSVQAREKQLHGISARERGGEMFAAFLEADERSRQLAAAAAAQRRQEYSNWPAASSQASNGTAPAVGTVPDNWFDVFSGPPASNGEPPTKTWSKLDNIDSELIRILSASSSTTSLIAQVAGGGTEATGSRAQNGDAKRCKCADSSAAVQKDRQVQEVTIETEKDADGEDDVEIISDGGLQAAVSAQISKNRKGGQAHGKGSKSHEAKEVRDRATRAKRSRRKRATGEGRRGERERESFEDSS